MGWGGGNNVHVNLKTHGLYGVHSKKICIWVIWGGVRVGWGGGNNGRVNLKTHGLYGVHSKRICIWVIWDGVRVGWGGGNNVHVNLKICHVTLWDLLLHLHTYVMLLHLHTYVMLRCGIFSCTCTMHICVWVVGDGVGWGMLTFHELQLRQSYIRANNQKSV